VRSVAKLDVSVITLIDTYNYGTLLQAFATQEKLREYSKNVAIIDYLRPNNTFRSKLRLQLRSGFFPFLNFLLTALFWNKNHSDFIKENFMLSADKYRNVEDFNNFHLHDGIYCTGSDQLWNSDYNAGIILPFYLSFVPKEKRKIAFSTSMGKTAITEEEIKLTKPFIDQYEAISVREDEAVHILKNQYDYHSVVQIVDPTLSISPSHWKKHAPKSKIKSEYILIYNLTKNKALNEYAKELSRQLKLPLYRLCPFFSHIRFSGKSILIPSVFEFITLIDHAKYLITDSFHGTAFAMNLNTEVIVSYPEKYSGRISSLLRLVGHEHRAIKDFHDFGILNRPTDFEHINQVLVAERKRVDEFLSNIFVIKEPL
jgi:hypothetical protein